MLNLFTPLFLSSASSIRSLFAVHGIARPPLHTNPLIVQQTNNPSNPIKDEDQDRESTPLFLIYQKGSKAHYCNPPSKTDTEFSTSLAAALLAVLLYGTVLRRWRRSSSSKPPPGPAGLPLVGSLPFLEPELHTYFARLASTHGPIFSIRLGTKLGIVVSSPVLAREVLKDHDPIFANRDVPSAARVIAYGGADIVWNPNGPTWRMLRRVCVREMLGPASLDAVYGLRRQEVRSTIHHLHSHAGTPVDVGAQMFLTVMNVITNMLWGGTVEGEERSWVGKEFRGLVAEITELLGRPNVSDFFPVLARFDLQGVERQMRVLLERFDRIFEPIIDRRRKVGEGGAKDFLEYMLRMEKEGGDSKTPFTMTHVKALLMVE